MTNKMFQQMMANGPIKGEHDITPMSAKNQLALKLSEEELSAIDACQALIAWDLNRGTGDWHKLIIPLYQGLYQLLGIEHDASSIKCCLERSFRAQAELCRRFYELGYRLQLDFDDFGAQIVVSYLWMEA